MSGIVESEVEDAALEWFEAMGWARVSGPDIAPGAPATERSTFGDVILRGRLERALARLNPDVPREAGQWMARRVAYLQGKGIVPNYEASMSKTFNSELGQRVADFGVNLLGLPGQLRDPAHAPGAGMPAFRFLDARRLTIGQGTSEINRNIIATRGLGMPR